jgi:hypothetical protein
LSLPKKQPTSTAFQHLIGEFHYRLLYRIVQALRAAIRRIDASLMHRACTRDLLASASIDNIQTHGSQDALYLLFYLEGDMRTCRWNHHEGEVK